MSDQGLVNTAMLEAHGEQFFNVVSHPSVP